MRKLLICLYAFLLVCSASSCMFYAPDEVEKITPHYEDGSIASQISVVKVKDYNELKNAVYQIISKGKEAETIGFVGYDGNAEADFERVCSEIPNETLLGMYRVYYMSGTVNKIVSYYEAKISITYRENTSDVKGINAVCDDEMFYDVIHEAMINASESEMLYIEPGVSENIDVYMERAICSDPMNVLYLPEYTAEEIIPEEILYDEAAAGKMIKVSFSYPKEKSEISRMKLDVSEAVKNIVSTADESDDAQTVFNIIEKLGESMQYVPTQYGGNSNSGRKDEFNAYGALINKAASSKGISLAIKALCDEIRIECTVVAGEYETVEHYWNIVKIDDNYYHIDASYCIIKGFEDYFLKNDDIFTEHYTWNTDYYPECDVSSDFSHVFNS